MAKSRKRPEHAEPRRAASPAGAPFASAAPPEVVGSALARPELGARNAEIVRRQKEFWDLFEGLRGSLQRLLMWGAFFLLIWLLRDFFALIFVTFVFAFTSASATRALGRFLPRLGWRARTVCVFGATLALLGGLLVLLLPQVERGVVELRGTLRGLPAKWVEEIDPWLYDNVAPYRTLVTDLQAVEGAVLDPGEPRPRRALWQVERVHEFLVDLQGKALGLAPIVITDVVGGITAVLTLVFLAALFSFLIVLDVDALTQEVRKLERTKLHGFYRETGRDIVKFGAVLGKVLEAQAVIALVNAALTALVLRVLGLPSVGFLSLTVFVCGFVPVAGVFLSSAPICLIALYAGGLPTLALVLLFIVLVHILEAYVLNPRIMGAALRVNPVLVLVILVVGHHGFGVWGLLLGVPVCYYFFTHVIKREDPEIGLRAKYEPRRRPA